MINNNKEQSIYEAPQTLETKWGRAKLQKSGYYQISAGPKEYVNKKLHRLIYEDFYGVTLLPWAVIHHIDNCPLNNNPENLECLSRSEHTRLHQTGQRHSIDYPTIVKEGSAPNKKQRYGLYFQGDRIVRHIKIQDLIDHARKLKFDKVRVLGKMKYLK